MAHDRFARHVRQRKEISHLWQVSTPASYFFNCLGSFTDIRGGHVYPSRIRKQPVRPLRVFLQDGEADLDNEFGNWWLANLQMAAALRYRGYDYQFVGGTGGHDGEHAGALQTILGIEARLFVTS